MKKRIVREIKALLGALVFLSFLIMCQVIVQ